MSQTYKKNMEANAKVYDLNQKTMKAALETLAFLYPTFQKAGKELNKEDVSYDEGLKELQEAVGKFKDAQRFAEIAGHVKEKRRPAVCKNCKRASL